MVMLLYLLQELLVSPQEELLLLHPLRVLLKFQIRVSWAVALALSHTHTAHHQNVYSSIRNTIHVSCLLVNSTNKHAETIGSEKGESRDRLALMKRVNFD